MHEMDDLAAEFYRLGREKLVDEALLYLDAHPELAQRQNIFYATATDFDTRLLAKCIELGADVNQVDQMGLPALRYAVSRYKIDKVSLLLENGADVNLGRSAAYLLNFNQEKPSVRKDIFLLMIEYGLDVNQPNRVNPGYNLLVDAMEHGDDEMVELIKAHGGKLTQAYLDALEREEVELDWDTFEDRLVDALRLAWTEVIRTRPTETFFMFGIETNDDRSLLTPYCNTEELVKQENPEIAECAAAKWNVLPDSLLYGAGKEHTESLAIELNGASYEDWTARKQKRIMKIFENALVRLDSEHLFGDTETRDRVILGIALIDADNRGEREMLRIKKRINPPRSLKPYLAALKASG